MSDLTTRFTDLVGRPPEGIWFAPGRVNLIGEHTDYNDGFVLPFALRQRARVAAARRDDEIVVMHALDLDESVELPWADLAPGSGGWSAYLAGVLWALREAGHPVGPVSLVLTSDVPHGAGLSSSAAIECATMAALCDLFQLEIAPMERAKLCQRAENVYVGAPTGLLDQAASTLCTKDAGMFLDCRSLEATTVPLPLADHGAEILVLDTHTPHSHVDGEYGERRATCEAAAALLGLSALRDVEDLDRALAALPDERMRKRVRHVVTENERTMAALTAARAGRFEELPALLDASHASMRDDYEITVPTVDLAVETARAAGALGARMTGGGFGGCIIAWCHTGEGDRIGQAISEAFTAAGFDAPSWFVATPEAGAGRLQ
ncbi:galactokinase [Arachnia propionica]|uniref:Galactokinase n=1 Tax=Arachnia propionica TaxID=1750 RepID=A0A3P1TDT0_9ACTN|nr:galactokinase [Arachnia propionica]MDO5082561.1 galactokinase [Arachnia propionica]RRD07056.1 galactokinase [Arachnia propionica]